MLRVTRGHAKCRSEEPRGQGSQQLECGGPPAGAFTPLSLSIPICEVGKQQTYLACLGELGKEMKRQTNVLQEVPSTSES